MSIEEEAPETIWFYPEQGNPGAGEWFWTDDLSAHDPDDVRGAIQYRRVAAEQAQAATIEKLREAVHEAWEEALQVVRGTDADMCESALEAYRVICKALIEAKNKPELRTLQARSPSTKGNQ